MVVVELGGYEVSTQEEASLKRRRLHNASRLSLRRQITSD
jgi:hypothetical protein